MSGTAGTPDLKDITLTGLVQISDLKTAVIGFDGAGAGRLQAVSGIPFNPEVTHVAGAHPPDLRGADTLGCVICRPGIHEYFVGDTTAVTGIIGLTLKKVIEKSFKQVIIVAIGFIITAILIAAGEFVYRRISGRTNRITLWRSALVGFFQGIAAFPGISRSGATISAGFFTGLDRETAVRYSFLVSILAIPGAFVMELKNITTIEGFLIPAAGFAAAFVSGFVALKALLRIVKTKYYILFAAYTYILGLILLCLELNGH